MASDGAEGSEACWAVARTVRQKEPQPAATYFDEVLSGAHCGSNWYEGNPGALGRQDAQPAFSGPLAPALLGFDESIDDFCAHELGGWEARDVKDLGHARERRAACEPNCTSHAPHAFAQ
eukprot:5519330-Prymnesium_polylepis.3